MLIHNYDKYSGEFISTSEADVSPIDYAEYISNGGSSDEADLHPELWLIPANSTSIAPIEPLAGNARVFRDNTWQYIVDNRGKTFYAPDGTRLNVTALDVVIPDGYTETLPIAPIEARVATVRQIRNTKLAGVDWLVVRHLTQVGTKTLTEEQYAALLLYMQQLRDYPATLPADFMVEDLVWPTTPDFIA